MMKNPRIDVIPTRIGQVGVRPPAQPRPHLPGAERPLAEPRRRRFDPRGPGAGRFAEGFRNGRQTGRPLGLPPLHSARGRRRAPPATRPQSAARQFRTTQLGHSLAFVK